MGSAIRNNQTPYFRRALNRLLSRGPIDTAIYSCRVIANVALSAYIDLRYGGRICRTVVSNIDRNPGAYAMAHTSYFILRGIFDPMTIKPNDVLVDAGCGQGRVLNFWLHRYPNNRIIGIEIDEAGAADLRRRYSGHKNVTIVIGDATKAVPADGTIFCLFNPFTADKVEAFERAVRALKPTVVYYNYTHMEPWRDWDVDLRKDERDYRAFRAAVIRPQEIGRKV